MPVPAPPSPHRIAKARRPASAVPVVVLVVTAAAGAIASLSAPDNARVWTATSVAVGWLCLAIALVSGSLLAKRVHTAAAADHAEASSLKAQLARQGAESAHLVNVTLPTVVKRLRDGASANETLAQTAPPSDPQLRQIVQVFASVVEEAVRHAADVEARRDQAQGQLAQAADELDQLTAVTLPSAIERLREGASADTVLAGLEWPRNPLLRVPAESFVRELAYSERRAAAAQAASAKALSRVQAKSVGMLADLRDMQERHGVEVFGDLLRLDHSTSQLGLMTDRLALLMGGRSSRAWNKPIVMESILRGAVGRISAYQRVRLHCSTTVAIAGFAAEGVMHVLAELMDNAANFSPPIDEVHVYVEERSAGIVVTIEDSGLKMADAAMRRAEESVSGHVTDLASLQGTRLGLAVVGRLAAKYGMSINFRPSSRGGTGVVVLLPPQLLAQQRDPAPQQLAPRSIQPATAPAAPEAEAAPERPAAPETPAAPVLPPTAADPTPQPTPQPAAQARPSAATTNGLPVRAPGRTMAEAEREREQRRAASDAAAGAGAMAGDAGLLPRDAGSRFGAFHRARRAAGDVPGSPAAPDSPTESGPPPAE
ncbi:ATP-binding protein [Streptomyces durmitorensis]|uniref:histidine kinase n=1 Tax=Streptomyces durmitorensis TaxID=319947 RepID=A0ABY4Q5G1_9ACTN|nr:ATP-binding protein [Streptomyces durmitorensis]UQT60369.1 ATP-binding protein [Streptomyces durmitorensis]